MPRVPPAPHIVVTAEEGGRYAAEFLLKFEGELKAESTLLGASNVTRWSLVAGGSEAVRRHRYRLEMV